MSFHEVLFLFHAFVPFLRDIQNIYEKEPLLYSEKLSLQGF